MQPYISNLRTISLNILLLYKNFFHWNLSKICIFLYSTIAGVIASIPFVGVMVYQFFASYRELGVSVSGDEFMLSHIPTVIITVIMLLCIVAVFICTFTYGNFLLQNVYKSYLKGEKLPITGNLYFSWKHFRTYIGILGWIVLYLLAPLFIGIILAIPFGIILRMSTGISSFIVGGVSLVIFIALFVWFIYLALRLIFSYYTFLYSEDIQKAKTYIKESFRLTKKKVWKIIFLILPFFVILGIITNVIQMGEDNFSENRIYTALRSVQVQSGQDDHKLLEGFFIGDDEQKEKFGKIEKAYEPMKNDINKNFLSTSMPYLEKGAIDSSWLAFSILFVLFSFIVFEGITSMIYLSVYTIISEKDKENNWESSVR